jgi:hypothetical protein
MTALDLVEQKVAALLNAAGGGLDVATLDAAEMVYETVRKLREHLPIEVAHRFQRDALFVLFGTKALLSLAHDDARAQDFDLGVPPHHVEDGRRILRAERLERDIIRRTLDKAVEAGVEPTPILLSRAVANALEKVAP